MGLGRREKVGGSGGLCLQEAMGSHRRLWRECVPGPQTLTLNTRF